MDAYTNLAQLVRNLQHGRLSDGGLPGGVLHC
jgi:hypothetical protein